MFALPLLALLLSASPRVEAEKLARQSMTDYNVGDFDSALKEATQAYKLDPRPGFLYNLGQVHRALHHWERAVFFFRGYLRGKPDAPNRAAVEKLIAEMEAKETEPATPSPAPAPAPTITVTPNPAPAPGPTQVPVVIENQPATANPAPLQAAPPSNEQQPRTILAAAPGNSGPAEGAAPVTKSHVAGYVLGGVTILSA